MYSAFPCKCCLAEKQLSKWDENWRYFLFAEKEGLLTIPRMAFSSGWVVKATPCTLGLDSEPSGIIRCLFATFKEEIGFINQQQSCWLSLYLRHEVWKRKRGKWKMEAQEQNLNVPFPVLKGLDGSEMSGCGVISFSYQNMSDFWEMLASRISTLLNHLEAL